MLRAKRVADRAETDRCRGWAWHRNNAGEDIYIRPARGSCWPVVLLDDLPPRMARGIAVKYASLVIETSSDNCQVWIATTNALAEGERAAVQRALATLVGADHGSVSGEHFGRAPCYRNKKPGRQDFRVCVLAATAGKKLDPSPVLASPNPVSAPQRGRGRVLTPPPGGHAAEERDESRKEFGFCFHSLRHAREWKQNLDSVSRDLVERLVIRALKRGKRGDVAGAREYAERTVRAARERLGV